MISPAMPQQRAPHRVVILAYPGVQSLDVTGPLEVFATAQRLIAAGARHGRGYQVSVVSRDGGALRSSSGLRILPDGGLPSPGAFQTLLVPGGEGRTASAEDEELVRWIALAAAGARRTAAVCTGAFLLARAGLLDGRRATTHWAYAQNLQEECPGALVDPEPIFIRDGDLWTSAGVTAGIDLALALVEQDHDRELALQIARALVMFLRRPGGQTQFSATLLAQAPEREPLRELQREVLEDVAADHRVEAMAGRVHMSTRHFARAFRAETGLTPARYVERVRVEAARRRLEETGDPVALVAAGCGFGTAETMRRAFVRSLGVAPADYRRRFRSARDSDLRDDQYREEAV